MPCSEKQAFYAVNLVEGLHYKIFVRLYQIAANISGTDPVINPEIGILENIKKLSHRGCGYIIGKAKELRYRDVWIPPAEAEAPEPKYRTPGEAYRAKVDSGLIKAPDRSAAQVERIKQILRN